MDKFFDFLTRLKDLLSLGYRALFILAGVCWGITLIPIAIVQRFGLLDSWSQIRPWVFIAALIFTSWLVFAAVFDLGNSSVVKLTTWRNSKQQRDAREKTLLATSRVEKEILARYMADDTTTLGFDLRDGIVNGLVAKGILYRASQASNPMSYDFDINIQDWAWEYLRKHPEVLKNIKPPKSKRHHIDWGSAIK